MPIFGGGNTGTIGTGVTISLYDAFSQNADKISNKFRTLEGLAEDAAKSVDIAGNKMKMGFASMAIGSAIIAPLVLATKQAVEFETGMAKINTTAQLSTKELGNLRNELLDIGSKSPGELNKIPDAFEKIISQTNDVALSTDILRTVTSGAKAGFTDIDTVAGALAQTLSIVGKENTSAANVMDTLFAAKRVGAGEFKDFAMYLPTLIAAGSNLGLTFDKTAGIFAYFTGKGQDAANATMLIQNAFSALQKTDIQKGLLKGGVSIFDESGKMRDIVDIFTDLNAVTSKMTQQQKTDFLAKVGLRDVQARNAFAILTSDVGKLQESMIATANPAGELANALKYSVNPAQEFEIAINKIKSGFIKLGYSLMPLVTGAANILGKVFGVIGSIFSAIANNPIGSFLMKMIGIVGLLAIAFGIAVVAANAKRWAIAQLATSFLALGKVEIAQIFLNQGLVAGFSAVAASIAPLLVELLPLISIGAVIIGTYFLVKKSMESFQEVMDGTAKPASGLLGILQRLGGVLYGAMEIWKSASSEGFSMSEKTANALKSLEIYDFVVNLGTWITRLKLFFTGIGTAVSEVWDKITKVANSIWDSLQKVSLAFGFDISKNTSNINDWIKAGKILGYIVGGVLVAAIALLTVEMISLAVSVLAVTWPLLLLIGIGYAIYLVIKNWGDIMDWIVDKLKQFGNWALSIFEMVKTTIVNAFTTAWDYIKSFVGWLFSLSSQFYNWGVSIAQSIYYGISSSWDWLKNNLITLLSQLPGGSYILDLLGNNSGGDVVPPNPNDTNPSPIGAAIAQNKAAYSTGNNTGTTIVTDGKNVEQTHNFNLYLDSKPIKAKVDKIDKQNDSRLN